MMRGTTRTMSAAAVIVCGGAVMCHAASLPVVAALPLTACATTDVPLAEQVMAVAVKALGGKEAIDKIKTLRVEIVTTMQGPQGEVQADIDAAWSRSGGRLMKVKSSAGETETGTDGKIAWQKPPTGGYVVVSREQGERMNNPAAIIMNVLEPERAYKADVKSVENVGAQVFDGKECHRLHYVSKTGKEGDLFYDIKTALPVGFETIEKRRDQEIRTTIVLGDWQEEQGVKFYRTAQVTTAGGPGGATMKVTKILVNTVTDDAFALPEDVKKAEGAGDAAGAAGATGKEIKLEDMPPEQQATAKKMAENLKSGGDLAKMKEAVSRIEPALGMINDPAKRLPIEYAIQEVKKEIAKLGG